MSPYLEFLTLRSFFGSVKVMIFERIVADDVVVDLGVAIWPEIPWLLFGIVRSVFQPSELVLEVQYVKGLFVAQGSVLVFGQHIDKLLLLNLSGVPLDGYVGVHLSDGVVTGLLSLHRFVRNLHIFGSRALELGLLGDVVVHILFPLIVFWISWEEYFIRSSLRNLLVQSCETYSSVCHFSCL